MAIRLIERPDVTLDAVGHRGLSAMGSVALHAAVALTLITLLQVQPREDRSNTTAALVPQHLVWLSHHDVGGGRKGGGDRSSDPARQARLVGRDTVSVPAAEPAPSTQATLEPPPEVSTIPARSMADSTQPLVGVIDSNGTTEATGPGTSGAGTHAGTDSGGLGNQPGPGFGDGARRGGPGVTMPALIAQVRPNYTADAMRARIQGSVWIECVVMPDGTVGDLRIMRSLDRRFGLDEEAIKAARRWRFKPGTSGGQPVPVIVSIELMFSVR